MTGVGKTDRLEIGHGRTQAASFLMALFGSRGGFLPFGLGLRVDFGCFQSTQLGFCHFRVGKTAHLLDNHDSIGGDNCCQEHNSQSNIVEVQEHAFLHEHNLAGC
ncbi:MAG: hypothetical protein BWY75_03526 [bacterium ADurb.Bin425]|nr:MAG: hypothetical protein BWY75_03526 [bacterium ADurb.Bin425]